MHDVLSFTSANLLRLTSGAAWPWFDGGFDAESWPYVLVRWGTYLALALVIGVPTFRHVVLVRSWRAQSPVAPVLLKDVERRILTLGTWATVAMLAASFTRLVAQSVAVFGSEGALEISAVRTLALETKWGQGWGLQLVAESVLLGTFAAIRATSGRRRERWWWVAQLSTVGLAFTPALSAHAAAVPMRATMAIVLDGLHVFGAGAWIGALCVLFVAALPAATLPDHEQYASVTSALFAAFSPLAVAGATILLCTGGYAAWLHLGHPSALWLTEYGRVLSIKLAGIGGVAALGAHNFRICVPGVGHPGGLQRLRRSMAAELLLAVLVLMITAILVAKPTPPDVAQTPSVGRAEALLHAAVPRCPIVVKDET